LFARIPKVAEFFDKNKDKNVSFIYTVEYENSKSINNFDNVMPELNGAFLNILSHNSIYYGLNNVRFNSKNGTTTNFIQSDSLEYINLIIDIITRARFGNELVCYNGTTEPYKNDKNKEIFMRDFPEWIAFFYKELGIGIGYKETNTCTVDKLVKSTSETCEALITIPIKNYNSMQDLINSVTTDEQFDTEENWIYGCKDLNKERYEITFNGPKADTNATYYIDEKTDLNTPSKLNILDNTKNLQPANANVVLNSKGDYYKYKDY
jgi:hypothetical protein